MVRAVVLVAVLACSARELPPAAPPERAIATAGPAASRTTTPVPPGPRLDGRATPLAYDLRLELDPARDTFAGRVEIRVRLDEPADQVWLHAVDLALGSATWRAGAASGALTRLAAAGPEGLAGFGFGARLTGEVTLAFAYTGRVGTAEEGLFRQLAGGAWFLYAQSQSLFARRILPCFDEPRFKPAWRVRVVVPGELVALGNGAQLAERALPDGRREVTFAEVRAMPSYLLSVAVGPFAVIDAGVVGRGKVPVRVAVAPADARRVGIVAAELPAIVDALERYVDRPLPLAKLDLVAVPRFFGAMENTGLITFDRAFLIADRKHRASRRWFVRVAAHELAHQWFGNAVTPAWWDDLWLSEGLTSWLSEKVAGGLGVWAPGVRGPLVRLAATAADASDGARALRGPVATAAEVEGRFDAISYDKATVVIDAIERAAGAERLRDVIRTYLARHAGGTATTRDLLDVVAATAPGAARALASYLDRAGIPIVDVTLDCRAAPALELRVRTAGFVVPVCARHPGGEVCRTVDGVERIALERCPAWLVPNAGGSGYYVVGTPAVAAGAPLTGAERLAHAGDLAAALLRGEQSFAEAVGALAAYARAPDAISQLAAVVIAQAIDRHVDDATYPAWTRWLGRRLDARLARALWATTPLELELRARLAPLVPARSALPAARALVDRALARGYPPPDAALAIAARAGGGRLFDRIVARAREQEGPGRGALLESLGAFDRDHAARVVALLADGSVPPGAVTPAVARLLARPATRTATWAALRDRAGELARVLSAAELDAIVEAAGSLCDATAAHELATAFGQARAAVRRRAIRRHAIRRHAIRRHAIRRHAIESIERCVARRAKLGDLAAALRGRP